MLRSFVSVQTDPSHDSVDATVPTGPPPYPPKPKAFELLFPAPPKSALEVFKLFTVNQLVPFQTSVAPVLVGAGGFGSPPKHKASVAIPAPPFATPYLTKFKSATSVQADPFQTSVFAVRVTEGASFPPKSMADVLLAPTPPPIDLAVFKSPTSVQLDPFQLSVSADSAGTIPPNPNAEV